MSYSNPILMPIFSFRYVIFGIVILFMISQPLSVLSQRDSTDQIVPQIFIPATLMITGLIINKESIKISFQEGIRNQFQSFDTNLDDYLSYVPSILDIGITLADKKDNNLKHITDILIAEVAMYATTKSIKKILDSKRPNGGGQSFPSGHTSQAFTGATLLYYHYKNEYPLLAYSGYLLASATGMMRTLNNDHWVSDVVFGAGLGSLVGMLTYHYNPIGRHKSANNVNLNVHGNGIVVQIRF